MKVSATLYHALLHVYSDDLVRDFGSEMAEVFEQDLESLGIWRAWRIALADAICIGVPRLLEKPVVAVPFLSAAVNMASLASELLFMTYRHGFPAGLPPGQVVVNVLTIGLLTAPMAWLAARRSSKNTLISLRIAG